MKAKRQNIAITEDFTQEKKPRRYLFKKLMEIEPNKLEQIKLLSIMMCGYKI